MTSRFNGYGALISALVGAAAALPFSICCLSRSMAQDVRVFTGQSDGPMLPIGMPRPGQRGGGPRVTEKTIDRFASILELDQDQLAAARDLHSAFIEETNQASQTLRASIASIREEFNESKDHTVFTERMPELMRSHAGAMDQLEKQLMSDLRSVLNPQQAERWPRVERAHRRLNTIGQGRLSAESVDLVELVLDSDISAAAREKLAPLLEQYEADLDRALVERTKLTDEAQAFLADRGGFGALREALDNEDFIKIRERAREARVRIREINQSFARQFAAELTPEEQARFNEEFTRRSFPQVYRPGRTGRALEAALAFEDLTPEQRQSLLAAKESYERELDRANREWADAIEEFETTDSGYSAALGGLNISINQTDAEKPDPVADARASRRALDRKTLDAITSILTDAQRERLPSRRARGNRAEARASGQGGPDRPFLFDEDEDEDGPVFTTIDQSVIRVGEAPEGQTAVFVSRTAEGEGDEEGDAAEHVEVHVVTTDEETDDDEKEAPKPE